MSRYSLCQESISLGNLILVNGDFPLKEQEPDVSKDFVKVLDDYPRVMLEAKAAACLVQLLRDTGGTDSIALVSGYRSLASQKEIYSSSLAEKGLLFTKSYVAAPGCSEHQSGLAIDLAKKSETIDFICPDFPDTGVCGQVRKQASKYGFIVRYTKEKESITHIAAEPWHFRYVGYPHSVIMEREALCLEEYVKMLHDYPFNQKPLRFGTTMHQIKIGYISEEEPEFQAPADSLLQASGNNVDGYIITLWE